MITNQTRAWWFGCWLEPGHYLVGKGGSSAGARDCPWHRSQSHDEPELDGGYAPRRMNARHHLPSNADPMRSDRLVFKNMVRFGGDRRERDRIEYNAEEFPQGQFLLHQAKGCTLLAWWDRTQGDTRGACNSVFIVEGLHDVTEMLEWFPHFFPKQAKLLADAGVSLVCVNDQAAVDAARKAGT